MLWLDQTGLRSDSSVGKGWTPVGQPPVVPKIGKRFGVNVMAAIGNKGELCFTCYRGSFTGPAFLAYLKRLVRQLDRKIHLIVDRYPVHRRVSVRSDLTSAPEPAGHLAMGATPRWSVTSWSRPKHNQQIDTSATAPLAIAVAVTDPVASYSDLVPTDPAWIIFVTSAVRANGTPAPH